MRVVEETNLADDMFGSLLATDNEKQLELLKNEKVTEFNEFARQVKHLTYENLSGLKLNGINLVGLFCLRQTYAMLNYQRLI